MARKVNKSEEVRKLLTAHPEMGPTEIAAELKSRKIIVSPNYVSNIKLKTKVGPGRRGGANIDCVLAAAEFIKTCGGVENAKTALHAAEKVVTVAS